MGGWKPDDVIIVPFLVCCETNDSVNAGYHNHKNAHWDSTINFAQVRGHFLHIMYVQYSGTINAQSVMHLN